MAKSYKYVIITTARNEENYIRRTIESVISQTVLPQRWVIVSDNSNDRTDEIISNYTKKYNYIKLIHHNSNEQRNFTSKVHAFNVGYDNLQDVKFDFIGNLDADISFAPNYYECILNKFNDNQLLGIAGGIFYEFYNGKFHSYKTSKNSVRGGIQLFRYKCFREIGGFKPLKIGGEDALAEILSRMNGWEVISFPEIKVYHNRPTGTGGMKVYRAKFLRGQEYYTLGYHPFFLILKCIYRASEKPFFIGSILVFCGFFWSYIRRNQIKISNDIVKYVREEQLKRIKQLLLVRKKQIVQRLNQQRKSNHVILQ